MAKPLDHEEAWDLACMKQEMSNLARCYLDLRRAAQVVVDESGPDLSPSLSAVERLRVICKTNLDYVGE